MREYILRTYHMKKGKKHYYGKTRKVMANSKLEAVRKLYPPPLWETERFDFKKYIKNYKKKKHHKRAFEPLHFPARL